MEKENILLRKPVFANDYKKFVQNINDGNMNTAMWWRNQSVMYVVFDLQKVYNVETVIFRNREYRGVVPFTIYVGNDMKICHLQKQIKKYKICKRNVIQNDNNVTIKCEGSDVSGRYIVIVKGEFLTFNRVESFNFYEIEAYGQLVGVAPPIEKLTIPTKPVKLVSRDDFGIAKIIRKNLPVIEVPSYTRGYVKINEKCEPVIWDIKWNLTFALACYTSNNKGKVIFFGREWYFWYIMNDEDKRHIRKGFVDWLSPNNVNPKYVDSKDFKSAADVRAAISDGDILDFNTNVGYPKDVMEEIKFLLFEGKISLIYDHNSFEPTDEIATRSNQQILDIFNVDYDTIFFTFTSGGNYSMYDKDFTEEFLDLKTRLQKLVDNHDYLLKFGTSVINAYNKMPRLLKKRADLTNLFDAFLNKYTPIMEDICPCRDAPATDLNSRAVISLFGLLSNTQVLANSSFKAPCIDLFPGDFKEPPKKETVTIQIKEELPMTRAPIGYYLAAGETLTYTISKSSGSWGMSIGCHSDILSDLRSEWYRYPDIYIDNLPLDSNGTVFSSFGGLLWLINTEVNSSIVITLSNVVATPFFNLMDKTAVSDWDNKQRHNPGLYAQIAGEDMVICEQSNKLRKLNGEYLKALMESWDRIVRNNYVFSGKKWKKARPSLVVLDIMTSIGYAHSGYPISAYDDWFVDLFDINYLKAKGSWGMCHELGHNQQPHTLWTMTTVVEVTNNIFCLFNTEKEWKLPYYGSTVETLKGDYDVIKKYLNDGASYNEWLLKPFVQLAIYIQMANNFGFGFYRKVFTYYLQHPELKAATDAQKLDLWVNITSTISGMNLIPMFDFWGIPVGKEVRTSLQALPCFLPDDFYTKASESREKFMLKNYQTCLRKSRFYEDFDPKADTEGHRPNFITKLNK